LPGPGEDAKISHEIVAIGRRVTSRFAVGVAQACFEIASNWTKDRLIAGKSARNRSLHTGVLGEMAQKIESARAYATEFANLCYAYGISATNVSAFVRRFYQQCLSRETDQGGLNYWVAALTSGTKTGADFAWTMSIVITQPRGATP